MSTRSRVAVVRDDGTVASAYVHGDGYVTGGVGEELATNHPKREDAELLVAHGEMRYILDGVGHPYDDADPPVVRKSLAEFDEALVDSWVEYAYIHNGEKWLFRHMGRHDEWQPLADALAAGYD